MFGKGKVIGIYTAHRRLSLSMYKGKEIKTTWVDIPNNIINNGQIVSKNLFAAFIKETMKEKKFRGKKAYFVIGTDRVLTRNIKLPKMGDEQLRINLPYEFRDSISGELKDYLYDYELRETVDTDGDGAPDSMELLGVAISKEYYETVDEILQMAGLKLCKMVPEVCILERYLKEFPTEEERKKERCFLDIGNRAIRFQIFKDDKFKLAQVIDIGENHLFQAIAEDRNIEMELARTYVRTNYEDCVNSEVAINAYKDISIEVMKGINYYEMSDMSSRLNEVLIYGTGALIPPFIELLKERLNMNVNTFEEAFPQFTNEYFSIVSIAMGILLKDQNQGSHIKNYVDFTEIFEKRVINWKGLFCGLLVIAIFASLFGKFAVYDLMQSVNKKKAEVAQVQETLDKYNATLEAEKDLPELYYHYTWHYMTDEEKGNVNRIVPMEIIELFKNREFELNGYSLKGNELTVAITTDSVDKLVGIIEELKGTEFVDAVSVSDVQRSKTEDTENSDEIVDVQMKITMIKIK